MPIEQINLVAIQGQYQAEAPFLIIGLLSLLGAAAAVNLPETTDERLPDTLEEAEDFGRGQVVTLDAWARQIDTLEKNVLSMQDFFRVPVLERWRARKRRDMVRAQIGKLDKYIGQVKN